MTKHMTPSQSKQDRKRISNKPRYGLFLLAMMIIPVLLYLSAEAQNTLLVIVLLALLSLVMLMTTLSR